MASTLSRGAERIAAGLVVLPRPTRWAASVLSVHFGADVMQLTYKKLEDV